MKALILAAGDGERLSPITQTLPKAMLPIADETIIGRLLRQLAGSGVTDVVIVVGYEAAQLRNHVKEQAETCGLKPTFIENTAYRTTNTAYSTVLAAKAVRGEPFLLIDGDIVAEDEVIRVIVESDRTTLLYEQKAILGPEEMKVAVRTMTDGDRVIELGKDISVDRSDGEFVGMIRFDADTGQAFLNNLEALPMDALIAAYYEHALNEMVDDHSLYCHAVDHDQWLEVDFVTDYLQAVRHFAGRHRQHQPVVSEQILLCPGPVMVSPRVKAALLHEDIGHRETEFIEILTRTRAKLLRGYGVRPSSDYTDVILTGSGTAANESLISSYGVGKRMLIPANGEFGLRLIDLATCHGIDVTPLDFGWTNPFDLDQIERGLASGRFDVLMMVHHETSTGMLNPVREVGALCTRYGVALCVDAVSSIGAEQLWIEEANVTFCTASANKAIACLPGLSFVCGKRSAFSELEHARSHTRYLDLHKHYVFEELRYQTPNTPAVSLFYALEAALDELLTDTLEHRMERYGRLASLVRTYAGRHGLETVIPTSAMARVLTTMRYPKGTDVEAFHEWVKKHNYVIYRGKGPLLGKAFQVANIGHVLESHVHGFLQVVSDFLNGDTKMVAGGTY